MSLSPLSAIPFPFAKAVGTALATAAGAAYLDAKYGLRSDIEQLVNNRNSLAKFAKAVQNGTVSLYDLFEELATRPGQGNEEAIWSHTECLTYAQTYDRIHQYAQWFLAQGVKPGQYVVFYMGNTPDFCCAWMGLMAIGAAPALINTNLASKALIHCINIAQSELLLADGDAELLTRIDDEKPALEASGLRVVHLDDVRGQIQSLKPTRPPSELRKGMVGSSPLALAYTSGTTGFPKAITFPAVMAYVTTLAMRRVNGSRKSRSYNCMPYYHLTGGLSALTAITSGEAVCIAQKFHARTFWSDIRLSRATQFIYVGETLRYLLAQPPSPLDKVHNVHSIRGNGLRPDVWIAFRDRFGIDTIHEFYNSTELMFGLRNVSRGDFTAKSLGYHGALMRWWNRDMFFAVAVDPETGDMLRDPVTGFVRKVPFEEGGEIIVKLEPGSKQFGRDFRGYWKNEEATSKKVARDVFKKGDAYYRTGDALRRDKEGRWFFNDRLGDTFRWKGENVSTTEVANTLGEFPGGGIVDANVYGVQLPGHDGRAGAVALVLDNKATFDFEAFLKHCRARLPRYAVPIFIRLMDKPFSTGNYKQDKVPLKTQGVDLDKVSPGDSIYWIADAGKGNTYVPFTREDWDSLTAGKARL